MTAMDIEERLRRYGDTLEDALQEPPISDYLPQAEPSTAPDEITTHRKRKLRVSVVTAVAAAILLVVGIAVVVADQGSNDVLTDSDSSPSVADPVSPPGQAEPALPTGVVDALGYRWSRVPHDATVFGGPGTQWKEGVTVGGPGLVAVGSDARSAAVWTSVDGFTWSRVPHNDAVLGGAEDGQHTEMRSVTVGGPGLVAVGGDWSGVNGQEGGAAVWTSPDGIDWTRVPHDETLFGGGMNSVAVGGPGLVAVGWDTMGAAVWTSPDGIDWTRAPHNDAIFGTQEPDLPVLEMRSIAAGGHGLVAVGANGRHPTSGATKSDAAVWVTEDQ